MTSRIKERCKTTRGKGGKKKTRGKTETERTRIRSLKRKIVFMLPTQVHVSPRTPSLPP
jgi:hypothetical protein